MDQQRIICEAGFIWRRVLRRVEERVKAAFLEGYVAEDIQMTGRLRLAVIVCMVKMPNADASA